eukprot:Opistho-2@35825
MLLSWGDSQFLSFFPVVHLLTSCCFDLRRYLKLSETADDALVTIAEEVNMAPCLLARLVLEVYCRRARLAKNAQAASTFSSAGTSAPSADVSDGTPTGSKSVIDAPQAQRGGDAVHSNQTELLKSLIGETSAPSPGAAARLGEREGSQSGAPSRSAKKSEAADAGDSDDDAQFSQSTNAVNPKLPEVKKAMQHPETIEDLRLREQVQFCILNDDVYSPLVEKVRHSLGIEYEYILQEKLRAHGIPFIGEDVMRSMGFPKTPDIRLEIPIVVEGCIVNWIESKASFGDEYSHKNYLKDQFWSYHNRYGPGMVIYWFGLIDELDDSRLKGIMLRDAFPRSFSILSGSGIRQAVGMSPN